MPTISTRKQAAVCSLSGVWQAPNYSSSKGGTDPEIANGAITEPSRTLAWLYLVEDGQFKQDPATSHSLVAQYDPTCGFAHADSDDRRFVRGWLKQTYVQTAHELQEPQDNFPD
ncbi:MULTISPECIES: hypothetical protein [Halorubrum]|uniref:hypothetical protein n=1 Tax=Halorubrum TaxID=56688 RepID=UPI0010F5C2CF|nr:MULTISPECIES: hypothetical protein [Halorubrum]MDB2282702.1 hypothetical protein [Halorubrum ezzemoulense]TKX37674.1 hypothetical protein EXE51_06155 [Halorubrum sp. CGM5_25_10-8B]